MSIIAIKQNRAVREDLVEIFLVGQIFFTEHGVVPTAAENPAIARMFRRVIAQDALDVYGIFCAFEIGLAEADGALEKMNVAIHKAGEDQFPTGVDYFCLRPAKFFDFSVIAHRDDFFAADCHGLRPGLFGVYGVDLSIDENSLGGLGLRILR